MIRPVCFSKKNYALLCVMIPVVLFAFSHDVWGEGELILSLRDATVITVRENRSLNLYDLDKKISENTVNFEKSIHIPNVESSYTFDSQKHDETFPDGISENKSDSFLLSLYQLNPYGGTSSLNFSSSNAHSFFHTGSQSQEFSSSLFIKYDQPVLRGFGREVTERNISKAQFDREVATQRYEERKSAILFNVFRNYFLLYNISEQLRLKRAIRKNTQEILDMVREKVDARKLPIIEQNTMEAALIIQDKEILDLENGFLSQKNQLMLSVYEDPKVGLFPGLTLSVKPEEVIAGFVEPDQENLKNSMETLDIDQITSRYEMKKLEQDSAKAISDLKPALTLSAQFGFGGEDLHNRKDSIRHISSSNYHAILAGTLFFPVTNEAARSDLARIRNKITQYQIQVLNRSNELENIVDNLLKDLATVRRKIELDRRVVEITKENLDNQIERFINEKSTALNTLDYQTDYINSQIGMVQSTVDYVILVGTYYMYIREVEDFMNRYN